MQFRPIRLHNVESCGMSRATHMLIHPPSLSVWLSLTPSLCQGPNLGGKTDDMESKIAMFWVLTVQQDGVKVRLTCPSVLCSLSVCVWLIGAVYLLDSVLSSLYQPYYL